MMRKIKFKNRIYYLTFNGNNSPITTRRQYENGTCSFAHLFTDGKIRRFNKVIGEKKDIQIIDKVKDLKPKGIALFNLLNSDWPWGVKKGGK